MQLDGMSEATMPETYTVQRTGDHPLTFRGKILAKVTTNLAVDEYHPARPAKYTIYQIPCGCWVMYGLYTAYKIPATESFVCAKSHIEILDLEHNVEDAIIVPKLEEWRADPWLGVFAFFGFSDASKALWQATSSYRQTVQQINGGKNETWATFKKLNGDDKG